MKFTKEELRIIETMAYSNAVNQARMLCDIAEKVRIVLPKNSKAMSDKAMQIYNQLMIISAKAGALSEA